MNLSFDIEEADPVHVQIERFLRQSIRKEKISAGYKFPPTSKLARLWGVDNKSIQRAMSPLVAQGLIERRPGCGTFVKGAKPKGLIAILVGLSLADESAHYYRAILQAIRAEARKRGWGCRVYDGLNAPTAPDQPHKDEMVDQLKQDVCNHDFKGQIHIGLRTEVTDELKLESSVPILLLEKTVWRDDNQFTRDSVEFLARKGRRKLAFLSGPKEEAVEETWAKELRKVTAEQGVALTEIPVPSVSRTGAEAEVQRQVTSAIREWRACPDSMPDSLIVMDDIMMRGVALALLSTGVRVPEEILPVVYTANRVRLHYGVPVVRFEFSADEQARTIVEMLWNEMIGKPLPPLPILLRHTIQDETEAPAVLKRESPHVAEKALVVG